MEPDLAKSERDEYDQLNSSMRIDPSERLIRKRKSFSELKEVTTLGFSRTRRCDREMVMIRAEPSGFD
jgi:hypothetical protein